MSDRALLGEAVAPPYRDTTATNWLGRMAQRGRDRQSWRDLLWWFGAPHLMRLRARLDRALLGPTSHARALEAPNASSTIKGP